MDNRLHVADKAVINALSNFGDLTNVKVNRFEKHCDCEILPMDENGQTFLEFKTAADVSMFLLRWS